MKPKVNKTEAEHKAALARIERIFDSRPGTPKGANWSCCSCWLVPYIGSKSKVSEVLSGRRPLSLSMIRRLVAGLHLPAEVAIQPTKSPRAPRAKPKPTRRRQRAPGRR